MARPGVPIAFVSDHCAYIRKVISELPNCSRHRCTYRELQKRSQQLSNALLRAGISASDRVATFDVESA